MPIKCFRDRIQLCLSFKLYHMLKNIIIGLPEENLMLMKVMSGNGKEIKRKLERKMPSMKKARRGKKAQHLELEKTLLEWVEERRLGGIAINTVYLRLQAKLIAKKK